MTEFDLTNPTTRILECAKCDEPVAADGASGRVTLACGYCGFEDVRELTGTREPADERDPYRDGRRVGGVRVNVDLERPPAGLQKRASLDVLRKEFASQKRSSPSDGDEARIDHEHRLLWLGTMIAVHRITARDYLRARAVYETTLELLSVPAYRAMVLARLARLASLSDAVELGEKWLRAVPLNLRIAEVTSDVKVADAMLWRSRKDYAKVLEVIGTRDTASDFVGPSRWLALVLRVDAHERRGEHGEARDLWRRAAMAGPMVVGSTASAFNLARATRRHALRRAAVALPLALGTIYLLLSMLGQLISGGRLEVWRVLAVVVCFVALFLSRRF